MRFLIVDDDSEYRKGLKRVLESLKGISEDDVIAPDTLDGAFQAVEDLKRSGMPWVLILDGKLDGDNPFTKIVTYTGENFIRDAELSSKDSVSVLPYSINPYPIVAEAKRVGLHLLSDSPIGKHDVRAVDEIITEYIKSGREGDVVSLA